jgi:hypothetical protein
MFHTLIGVFKKIKPRCLNQSKEATRLSNKLGSVAFRPHLEMGLALTSFYISLSFCKNYAKSWRNFYSNNIKELKIFGKRI